MSEFVPLEELRAGDVFLDGHGQLWTIGPMEGNHRLQFKGAWPESAWRLEYGTRFEPERWPGAKALRIYKAVTA